MLRCHYAADVFAYLMASLRRAVYFMIRHEAAAFAIYAYALCHDDARCCRGSATPAMICYATILIAPLLLAEFCRRRVTCFRHMIRCCHVDTMAFISPSFVAIFCCRCRRAAADTPAYFAPPLIITLYYLRHCHVLRRLILMIIYAATMLPLDAGFRRLFIF